MYEFEWISNSQRCVLRVPSSNTNSLFSSFVFTLIQFFSILFSFYSSTTKKSEIRVYVVALFRTIFDGILQVGFSRFLQKKFHDFRRYFFFFFFFSRVKSKTQEFFKSPFRDHKEEEKERKMVDTWKNFGTCSLDAPKTGYLRNKRLSELSCKQER